MKTADCHPLRLTPFEEYMLLDDRPAYPMSCFFMIKLRGQFNASVFELALQKALENHPLLTSSVTETNGQFYWQNTGKIPEIARLPLDEERRFPASKGINLFHEPALKVTICNNAVNPAAVELDGQTNIIFEIHHSATDAAGIARCIEDTLCGYALQTGFAETQRESVEPALLVRRGSFGRKPGKILRTLPKQFWGLLRAWTFLTHRVSPLTPEKPDRDAPQPPAGYPAILYRNLTTTETQSVQLQAKQLGITINDLFLCAAFFAMKHWRGQHVADKNGGYLRIAVPTNLRTSADDRMPAANIVSMVFLDRKPKNIQDVSLFYQGIYREMQHIKRCNLGWAFIHGLTMYQRVFGGFRKMIQQERCWTTATVTNLGQLFTDVPLPMREGRVQIDESLELIGVETAPPVRPWTALGISVLTYAGGMTINLHYDSGVLTQSDAQSIWDGIVRFVHLPTTVPEAQQRGATGSTAHSADAL